MNNLKLPETPWQQWKEHEWNRALFIHYFVAWNDDIPVTRLIVTGRELARATGCGQEKAEEVERDFIGVLAKPSSAINRRYSADYFSFESGGFIEPPPAVIYLLFTCYLACGTEQVVAIADFRRRLAKVLQHPTGTSYPLAGLPELWKKLRRWLGQARAAGHRYRELVLPDPGWMTRIGYSLRLAFPARQDQVVLNRIIPAAGFAAQPPIPALLRLLGRNLPMFSESFKEAYEEFRRAFVSGHADLNSSALLAAVQEAMEQSPAEKTSTARCPNLRLSGEVDEQGRFVLVLLSDHGLLCANDPRLKAVKIDYGLDDLRFVVTFGTSDSEGIDSVIRFLLEDEFTVMLRGFASTTLCHVLREGVLLFYRGVAGSLECTPNLNVEGALRVLVRSDLAEEFARALVTGTSKHREFVSAYDGWREFTEVDASRLRSIDWRRYGDLAEVRALQPCAPASRISLVGGIPTGEPGTWFGHTTVLPAVRVHGGAATVDIRDERAGAAVTSELAPAGDIFIIPAALARAPLDGNFLVTARAAGQSDRILRKNVRFRAFVDCYQYREPSDPAKWLCESSWRDMAKWDAEALFAGASDTGRNTALNSESHPAAPASPSDGDMARLPALTEICAAIACRRSGLAESEIMELFAEVLGVRELSLVRQILRAWMEAGHVDCAINVAWRTRRYFGRHPRLVARRCADGLRLRLVGLAPAVMINRLRDHAAKLGAVMTQYPSWSTWLTGPWEIQRLGLEQAQRLSEDLGLGKLRWTPAHASLISAHGKVEGMLEQRPANYDVIQCWSWSRRRFVEPANEESELTVRVVWCQRSGRLDCPDYYLIQHHREDVFVTYSRNWALLVAARLAGVKPYIPGKSGLLTSGDWPWVHLPPSVGRFAFAAGSGACGPARNADGQIRYFYPLGSEALGFEILMKLGLVDAIPRSELPRWLVSLAQTRAHIEPLVPLRSTTGAIRRVPLSLRPVILAHLRRGKTTRA